jgi:hypothetical protein
VSDTGLLTFSKDPFLAGFEAPAGAEGVVVVFACLVLVLPPSWAVVEAENEALRNAVEPRRALDFESVVVPWLCRRGLDDALVPEGVCGEGGAEDAVGPLEGLSLPCRAAQESTEDSESLRSGWRGPSGLCFWSLSLESLGSLVSLVSLDMALAGRTG